MEEERSVNGFLFSLLINAFFLSTFSVLGYQISAWSNVPEGTDQTVLIASSLKLTNS